MLNPLTRSPKALNSAVGFRVQGVGISPCQGFRAFRFKLGEGVTPRVSEAIPFWLHQLILVRRGPKQGTTMDSICRDEGAGPPQQKKNQEDLKRLASDFVLRVQP